MKNLKKIIASVLLITMSSLLYAQKADTASVASKEKLKVAIFDPDGIPDKYMRMSIREMISTAFVNTGEYIVLERELIDKVMKEQAFTNTDLVDENQAIKLGELAGANKAVLSVVTSLPNGSNMLTEKLIDIRTGIVEQQQTKSFLFNNLSETVETTTLVLIGKQVADASKEITFVCEPFSSWMRTCEVEVFLDGKKIWSGGREGFEFIYKDKNPGKHKLIISVEGTMDVDGSTIDGKGGFTPHTYSTVAKNKVNSFNINTLEREHYKFTTSGGVFGAVFKGASVKLEKNKKK